MVMSNLKDGINIKEEESLSYLKEFKGSFYPERVVLHLSQHTGKSSLASVTKDQVLKAGEKVGDKSGFISSSLHSSISGRVKAISGYNHPILGRSEAIYIEREGKDSEWIERKREEVLSFSAEELIDIIDDSGIVGGGADARGG